MMEIIGNFGLLGIGWTREVYIFLFTIYEQIRSKSMDFFTLGELQQQTKQVLYATQLGMLKMTHPACLECGK